MNEEEDAVIISQNYIPKKMRAPPPPIMPKRNGGSGTRRLAISLALSAVSFLGKLALVQSSNTAMRFQTMLRKTGSYGGLQDSLRIPGIEYN